jgi:TonB family protein
MSTAVSEQVTDAGFLSEAPRILTARSVPPQTQTTESPLLVRILTASIVVHLLLIGILGSGIPKPLTRPTRPASPPPTEAKLIEDVKLQEEEPLPAQPKPIDQSQVLPAPELPAAAQIDLPPISQVEPISAVPASVPVAFGLEVKGRVRIVTDAAQASGSIGGRALKDPVAIDGDSSQEKNLLLPPVVYPPEGLVRRQQGTVVLEFRTSVQGEIYDVKVHSGSGHPAIDRAALANLAQGKWLGAAGYYLKAYEFKLN